MKKESVIILSIFLLVICSFVASATADVAYLYRKNFKIDDNILTAFNQSGLSVELIQENNLPIDFSKYKMIFVGDENFYKENLIPVNDYPSIIVNYYHSTEWGFTDVEGVSQLAADTPLSVLKNNQLIQVYTAATESIGGPAISYYYLDIDNKAPEMDTVALTQPTASDGDFGDVISFAEPGTHLFGGKIQNAKLCFFGIVESDYWTSQGRALFDECIGFVSSQCNMDSDCSDSSFSEPFCKNGDVYKTETYYTCEDGAFAQCVPHERDILVEECAFGCENGACIGQCDSDSDCGVDGPVDGLFCFGKNVSQQFQDFTCNNPGQVNSYCSSNTTIHTIEVCDDTCLNGTCQDIECFTNSDCNDLNFTTEDICHNPGTVDSFCTNEPIECFENADCGTDGFIGDPICNLQGDVSKTFRTFICSNPGTSQSQCLRDDEQRITECSDTCVNGVCVDIECYNDSECDDSNPLTLDQCVNPGTVASDCVNVPLNCASDADCGFTGFLGSEFCSNDDVMKNFQNATCKNPGQTNSFCSINVLPVILDECEFACSDSACVRCDSNSDCDDSNSGTVDLCHNPGTAESYCTNEPTDGEIECTKNSDCGIDSVLSPDFCLSKDVVQLVQTYTCNNPNTTLSYCSSDIEPNTVETCSDFCLEGDCVSIECFNHEDCDDYNSTTLDICNNPGTPESFCTNTPFDVTCFDDSDCGVDGPLGNNFCLNNDLFRLMQTYKCNAPGTSISFCSSNVVPRLVEECAFICSVDHCIPMNGECTPGEIRSCGSDVGECSAGVELCLADASWSEVCFGSIGPTMEVCDGKDNDCDGLIDEGDVCGPSCTNDCNSGDRQCYSDGYRVCGNFDSDVCAEWSPTTSCQAGQICQSGYCVSSCSDECISGQRQCDGNGYKICGNYDADSCTEWNGVTPCGAGEICSNGYCSGSCTNECSFGERGCFLDGWRLCGYFDSDSCTDWSGVTTCGDLKTCNGGFCA